MCKLGVDGWLVRVVQVMCKNAIVNGTLSEDFVLKVGVLQ